MPFMIGKMTQNYAIEVLCWKYERPYNFYNHVLTSSAIMELLGSKYYVVLDDYDTLIGYFCTGMPAQVPAGEMYGAYEEKCVDVGFGMKPEFTGKGNGYKFLSAILGFVEGKNKGIDLRLTVATFNKRAIHLYEKIGFVKQMQFHNDTTEFITMIKKVN